MELKVQEFLNEVDSNSPAPGGGSVSALASALGSSLGRMVAHLTFGKKLTWHWVERRSKILKKVLKS